VKLDEFVQQSLTDVVMGVKRAQEALAEIGEVINPVQGSYWRRRLRTNNRTRR
jgi:hypothetical protein